MEDIDIRIRQQEAAVLSIEMMVRFRRCAASELVAVKGELERLRAMKVNAGVLLAVEKTSAVVVQKVVQPGKEVRSEQTGLGSEILREIRGLQNDSAELSNQLHVVPEGENCIHLTAPLVSIRRKIEGLWTKYRYLEKNGVLPDVDDSEQEEKSVELILLMDKKKPLMEERSKLRAKLRQAGNRENLKDKWRERLAVVEGIIGDLDVKIRVLK